MFAGHLAAGFIGKRVAPEIPLSAMVAAAFALDLLWPLLLLLGVETVRIDPGNTAFTGFDFVSYPWSHSLVATLVWSALGWVIARRLFGSSRGATVVAVLVASHWALDFVTHRPDLPLWPGGIRVGLGLWNSIPGTIAVEGALTVAALAAYLGASRPRDGIGRWALWGLVGLVVVIWVSGPWAPPPSDVRAIAYVGLAMWLLPPWGGWIDRHRVWAAAPGAGSGGGG